MMKNPNGRLTRTRKKRATDVNDLVTVNVTLSPLLSAEIKGALISEEQSKRD